MDLIAGAKAKWLKNQVFYYLSKLLLIVNRCGADVRMLNWVIQCIFVRMTRGVIDGKVGSTALRKDVLPPIAVAYSTGLINAIGSLASVI